MALSLPTKPHLERFRRDARRLQRGLAAGDVRATVLVRRHHPDPPPTERFRLADAQLVIARAYGFASWPRLRHYLDLAAPITRNPAEDPVGDDPADRFCAAACLVYAVDDGPPRWAAAADLAARHPELAGENIWAAAVLGDADAVARHLAADPTLVRADGGPYRWVPLLYLTYARVPQVDPIGTARLLIEAGADVDAGYLWGGLPTPFTVLTGCFGEGEQGPGRQPRHPYGTELARLLLEHGAEVNDGQTLYNRMFGRDDSHLELLLAYGLGTGDGGVWRDRLDDALEPVPEMMDRQLDWARTHGFTERLALLARHGFTTTSTEAAGSVAESTPSVLRAGNPAAVAAAVAAGADVDEREDGRTALHHFAWIGDVEMVRALLAAGADVTLRDAEHGTTPYAWAVHAHQPATAALLGPDPLSPDQHGPDVGGAA